PAHSGNGADTFREEILIAQIDARHRWAWITTGRAILYVGRRRGPHGADPAAAESWYGCRAEPGHHNQVSAADAGDQLALAAAHAALGGRAGRYVQGQPAADVRRGGRPVDVRQDRRPCRDHSRGAGRAARPAVVRGPGGAVRAGDPLPAAGDRTG